MFSVFSLGNLVGFWGNKKEDNWATNTISKLKLEDPKIYWYEVEVVKEPELYRFDEQKNIVIQARNENGEVVDTEEVLYAEPYSF